jgi:hypothetical protein
MKAGLSWDFGGILADSSKQALKTTKTNFWCSNWQLAGVFIGYLAIKFVVF